MRLIPVDAAGAVADAVDALRAGGAVVLPTDTVYGLAVLPVFPGAVDRLFVLKGRPAGMPVAVLVDDVATAEGLAGSLPEAAQRLAARYWPGPLTLVLRRGPGFETDLGGAPGTVGVRCPDHDFVRAVAAGAGPLAVTSANADGEPPPPEAGAAAAALTGEVELVVDGGAGARVLSTVVDCTSDPVRVLRAGASSAADIRRVVAVSSR